MSEISEKGTQLINQFAGALLFSTFGIEPSGDEQENLESYIAALEAEVAELRAFRDGYDPKVRLPKEDKDYPGYSTPVLTFGHSPDGVDFEVERLALYDDYSDGYVIRWYLLPPPAERG